MPTYEYRCKQCQHEMEEFQSMKEDPLVMCPVCHTPNLVRLISNGAGLIFKGKGFYLTDYKKGTSEASNSSASRPKNTTGTSEQTASSPSSSESSTPAQDSAKSGESAKPDTSKPTPPPSKSE